MIGLLYCWRYIKHVRNGYTNTRYRLALACVMRPTLPTTFNPNSLNSKNIWTIGIGKKSKLFLKYTNLLQLCYITFISYIIYIICLKPILTVTYNVETVQNEGFETENDSLTLWHIYSITIFDNEIGRASCRERV